MGEERMCQGTMERLLNHSESCRRSKGYCSSWDIAKPTRVTEASLGSPESCRERLFSENSIVLGD